jgi:hypothetical protein
MENTLLTQGRTNLAFVIAAVLVAAITAEGSPGDEKLLVSAGFKVVVTKTVSQRQQLETLPKGQVSPVTQNGETFYVYPDARAHQLYVGDEAQYQTLLDQVTIAGDNVGQILITDYVAGNRDKAPDFSGWERFDGLPDK